MATFKICVFRHHKRRDGKYPVSIRVSWKRHSAYIKTESYVTDAQLNKRSVEVKDPYVLTLLAERIKQYEDIKTQKLGSNIENFTAKELATYLDREYKAGGQDVDFIAFGRDMADKVARQGRKSTAETYKRTLNAIIDYCNGREKITANEITVKFLQGFADYLRSERTMTRKNQFNRSVTVTKGGLSEISVNDYLTDVRTIFNAAIDEYNDDEKGVIRIKHYPFRKLHLAHIQSAKRSLSLEDLRKIFNTSEAKINRDVLAEYARDIFVLSFLLCGMNLADLYECENIKDGRIEYYRKKTRNRRSDKAFISIKLEQEVVPLVEKYRDTEGRRVFRFYHDYSDSHIFSSAINKKLKRLAKLLNIAVPLTTYYARHSWATIARNKAGVSRDDIDLALNHVDQSKKMADVYIEKDWTLIDRANRAVIDYVKGVSTLS